MAASAPFRETVVARVKREAQFAEALLREAIDAFLAGDPEVGKDLLRDCIDGTLGYEKLAKELKLSVKGLKRILEPCENPRLNEMLAIIEALQRETGVQLHVAAE